MRNTSSFPKRISPRAGGSGKAALVQALAWLREAKRPAVLSGGGVWFARAAAELTRSAELTNAPVMTGKARGSIPEEHQPCFGGFGAIHPAIHTKSGGSADLVILLGARIGCSQAGATR
jgi:acetolactate synthase-1/2/3 large subunit